MLQAVGIVRGVCVRATSISAGDVSYIMAYNDVSYIMAYNTILYNGIQCECDSVWMPEACAHLEVADTCKGGET